MVYFVKISTKTVKEGHLDFLENDENLILGTTVWCGRATAWLWLSV